MSDEPNLPDNQFMKNESAKDTDLRIQSHPDTPLPIKNKSSKKKLFLTLLIALIVIAAAAVAVFYFMVPKSAAPEVEDNDAGYSSATKFGSPKELISKVASEINDPIVGVTESNGFGGKTSDGFGAYSVPPYKVGDRKFSNLPVDSSGSSYRGSSAEEAKTFDILTNFFKDNKFKKVASGENTSGINQWFSQELNYVSYATYESNEMLCMIWHVDATTTSIKNHVTSIGCSSKESYAKAAKELDQYYTAYAKDADNSGSESVVLGMPSVTAGSDNYINATVYQEDPDQLDTQFQGLYYKTADQKEWTYFTGAYGLLSCTDYNTDILKKAFKGFNCYNDVAKSYATVN